MTSSQESVLAYVVTILFSALMGFILCLLTCKPQEKVEIKYVTLPEISDEIIPDEPIETVDPPAPEIKWLTKTDTVYSENVIYVTEKVDTAAILADWAKIRTYSESLFSNDTIGALDVEARVQYNQLQQLGYTFVPVRKETTVTKIHSPLFRPFVLGGVNSHWRPSLEIGTFTRSGFGASYEFNMLDDKQYLHSLKVGYTF